MVILRISLLFTSLICFGVAWTTDYCTQSKDVHYQRLFRRYRWEERMHSITLKCTEIELPLKFIEFDDNIHNFFEVRLKIEDSNLTEIEANSFIRYSMITDLDLSQNNVTNIKQEAFAGLSSLENLFLSRNALTELKADVFNSLQQLRTLDVSMNRIKDLNLYFLTDTIHLTYLNLSKNSLTYFDDLVLGQNHYIAQLNLSDNQISQLILNRSSHRIAELDVSNNKLTVVDMCLPGLLSLNISYNNIKYLLAGKCAINMTILRLDVSHNLVNEVNVKNISKLNKLEFLNIGYNDMSSIPNDLFVNMSNLTYLDLSNNKLLNLEYGLFDSLKLLTYLDLSYNKLKTIKRYFYALYNLVTLKINDNDIVNIYSNLTFGDLSSLKNIYLDGNKFECKQMLEILSSFKMRKVETDNGTLRNKSNVYGISCFENNLNTEIKYDLTSFFKNMVSSRFEKHDEGDEFRRTVMYSYFNKDFLNSNFYKYLESFKSNNLHNADKYDTLKLLKSEFENSKFYQFLENFNANENSSLEFSKHIEKYLEELKSDIEKELVLRDNSENEQLHGSLENTTTNSYNGMFSVVILLLLILVLVNLIKMYTEYTKNKTIKKEEQELLEQVHSEI